MEKRARFRPIALQEAGEHIEMCITCGAVKAEKRATTTNSLILYVFGS
jgi:hypothetical protein